MVSPRSAYTIAAVLTMCLLLFIFYQGRIPIKIQDSETNTSFISLIDGSSIDRQKFLTEALEEQNFNRRGIGQHVESLRVARIEPSHGCPLQHYLFGGTQLISYKIPEPFFEGELRTLRHESSRMGGKGQKEATLPRECDYIPRWWRSESKQVELLGTVMVGAHEIETIYLDNAARTVFFVYGPDMYHSFRLQHLRIASGLTSPTPADSPTKWQKAPGMLD